MQRSEAAAKIAGESTKIRQRFIQALRMPIKRDLAFQVYNPQTGRFRTEYVIPLAPGQGISKDAIFSALGRHGWPAKKAKIEIRDKAKSGAAAVLSKQTFKPVAISNEQIHRRFQGQGIEQNVPVYDDFDFSDPLEGWEAGDSWPQDDFGTSLETGTTETDLESVGFEDDPDNPGFEYEIFRKKRKKVERSYRRPENFWEMVVEWLAPQNINRTMELVRQFFTGGLPFILDLWRRFQEVKFQAYANTIRRQALMESDPEKAKLVNEVAPYDPMAHLEEEYLKRESRMGAQDDFGDPFSFEPQSKPTRRNDRIDDQFGSFDDFDFGNQDQHQPQYMQENIQGAW